MTEQEDLEDLEAIRDARQAGDGDRISWALLAAEIKDEVEDDSCPGCAGCGRIANDDDQTPWKYWAELPLQSSIAVLAGFVRPLICSRCNGSGKRGNQVDD